MQLGKSYLGFTDSMAPMRAVKVQIALDKRYRYDGQVMSRKEFISTRLSQGYLLEMQTNVCYENMRTGEPTKPKDVYQFREAGKRSYFIITKTEYEFGMYLQARGLITEQAVEEALRKETVVLQAKEQAEAAEKERQAQIAQSLREEADQFKNWLKTEAAAYPDGEKLQVFSNIFNHLLGDVHPRQKQLLVLIDHIDDPRCKEELKQRLSLLNKASRTAFSYLTGYRLPRNYRETVALIDRLCAQDFRGVTPFVPPKPKQETTEIPQEIFYRLRNGHYQEVLAEPLKKYGLELFQHKQDELHYISEATSGALLVVGKTKTEAHTALKNLLGKHSVAEISSKRDMLIQKFGISPRYQKDCA